MCGIVAVLRRPPTRDVPELDALIRSVEDINTTLARGEADPGSLTYESVRAAARSAALADTVLRVVPGVIALNRDAIQTARFTAAVKELSRLVYLIEAIEAPGAF